MAGIGRCGNEKDDEKVCQRGSSDSDVELSKAVAVLMVLLTAEAVSSRMEGTQPCKDFTKTSHIKNYSIIFNIIFYNNHLY